MQGRNDRAHETSVIKYSRTHTLHLEVGEAFTEKLAFLLGFEGQVRFGLVGMKEQVFEAKLSGV